jgi:Ca2+-transporting ATPase
METTKTKHKTLIHSLEVSDSFEELKSSHKGLSKKEAELRLERYGPNELEKKKKITPLQIFIEQFTNPFILLTVFAGILSLVLGQVIESISIFIIIFINAVLGFIQEYKAERSIEALQKISAPTAKVVRDGETHRIPAREVVPGDILLLEAGDILPADSRLIEVSSLQIDEASLTGESVPSKKVTTPFEEGTSIADQENMAFMSTVVTYGKGKAIVTATGMRTELGKIAASLQTEEDTKTPLQTKFEQLAKQIGVITVFLVAIVFIAGMLQGTLSFTEILLVALVLTVSTIPNSLPLVVTVGLSLGTKELSKRNMLIRKLSAAESLGAATIIVSDKTGTITKNQMTVTDIYYNNQTIKVTGSGYDHKGEFTSGDCRIDPKEFELLLRIGVLCNNAKFEEKEGRNELIGDPTEGSLIVLGMKGCVSAENLAQDYSYVEELPFDSDRKCMSVIYKNKINNTTEAYVKGAPDLLLELCDRMIVSGEIKKLSKEERENILRTNNSFAENSLRVLALAYREVGNEKYEPGQIEKNLVFTGLTGMIDPPRDEVAQAIVRCKHAGIKVMVITGDHAITTKAVGRQIGLFEENDIVLTGEELDKMSDDELEYRIDKIKIIARALPIQKLRIVTALQKRGHVVAMTGDGVNDAPALKKADIGVSMGITGTDVAKEVSKATLLDDNFASIVKAIETGRNIYDTLIRSAKFFLACNAGEIFTVMIALLIKFPLPILPLQILLMNMLTDNLPALGLSFEKPEKNIMRRPPRNPKDQPINKYMLTLIVVFGLMMGLGTLWVFSGYKDTNLPMAQTMAFTTLVAFQMFAVLSSRSLTPSLEKLNPLTNIWLSFAIVLSVVIQCIVIYYPPMQEVFGTVALGYDEWVKIILVSSLGFIGMEISKLFYHISTKKK